LGKFFLFSSEIIKSVPLGGFDFSGDLRRYIARPQFFKGGVAVIPQKFHNAIRGSPPSADAQTCDRNMLDGDNEPRKVSAVAPNGRTTDVPSEMLAEKIARSDADLPLNFRPSPSGASTADTRFGEV
jgi:hypothetical protein